VEKSLACPFFMPIEKLENGSWLHASRLPLGRGWSGHCSAPGHEGETPSMEQLEKFCNLGYAEQCPRFPRERLWDSVRFGARISVADSGGVLRLEVRYVCEREHLPAGHGWLEFDAAQLRWITQHPDARVQRMAACFVATYLERKNHRVAEPQVEINLSGGKS
jgi:hypothetical protein